MSNHKKNHLLKILKSSLISKGGKISDLNEEVHPFVFKMNYKGENRKIKIYIWNVTHGGGSSRPQDEYRIQITGVSKFVRDSEDQIVLILGWYQELEVFIAFDFFKHTGELGSSPSMQIKEEAIKKAVLFGYANIDKGNGEFAVAFAPDYFIQYLSNIESWHNKLITPDENESDEKLIIDDENNVEITNESNVPITIPFDPNLIKIRRDPYTLGQLLDKMEYNEVNFQTAFQRKEGLWNIVQMSRLIESILLRLPLPAFYFDENSDNVWEVIDGLQRCTALRKFVINKDFKLKNLEFLKDFEGVGFDELPRDLVRRIKTSPIVLYVVEPGTPKEVKFNIFKRINTGGLILTPQEIRHALNQGKPAKLVEELSEYSEFKKATNYRIKSDRMEDRDFITRFVSFYLIPYYEYQPDLDSFMTKGMSMINEISNEQVMALKSDFKKSMTTSHRIFGYDAFRKRQNELDRRKPINKALFESLSVCFGKLSKSDTDSLIGHAETFKRNFIKLNNQEKFLNSLSSGTGQKESVFTRFREIEELIKLTLRP